MELQRCERNFTQQNIPIQRQLQRQSGPMTQTHHHEFTLAGRRRKLANLCGPFDQHLREIEMRMGVELHRGMSSALPRQESSRSSERFTRMFCRDCRRTIDLQGLIFAWERPNTRFSAHGILAAGSGHQGQRGVVKGRGEIRPNICCHATPTSISARAAGTARPILLCIGRGSLERVARTKNPLVRPAVEGRRKTGFLPGDLSQKSIPICVRSMMHFTKCWGRQVIKLLEPWSLKSLHCLFEDATKTMPMSFSTKRKIPNRTDELFLTLSVMARPPSSPAT